MVLGTALIFRWQARSRRRGTLIVLDERLSRGRERTRLHILMQLGLPESGADLTLPRLPKRISPFRALQILQEDGDPIMSLNIVWPE